MKNRDKKDAEKEIDLKKEAHLDEEALKKVTPIEEIDKTTKEDLGLEDIDNKQAPHEKAKEVRDDHLLSGGM